MASRALHLISIRSAKQKRLYWTLAVIALVGLTYANSFHNSFHFDDSHTIVDNPYIRSLRNIPRFFSDATTFSVLPANRTYRPVVSTSLAVDYALGRGLNPVFFHIDTFLAFLVQILGMQILFASILNGTIPREQNGLIALFAAAWYGVHPAMAETVNYVIQRGDVFSACGVVVGLALYIRWPRLRRSGLYLIPFVLAMLSKPPAIVFPVLLFVYIAMFEAPAGRPMAYAAVRAIPSAVVGAGLMALSAAMTPKTFAPSMLSGYSYLITQPFVLLRYFGSFFLPIHLNVDTDLEAFHSLTANALWGFLFVALLIAAVALLARWKPMRPAAFGLLWFLISSLPTSLYPLSEVENDHRMFLPFVGLALAVTWAAYLAVEHVAAIERAKYCLPAARILGLLLIASYAWGAHVRNEVWRSEETLWRDDVAKSPRNGRGWMNYGLTQLARGRYEVARLDLERAWHLTPAYPTLEINLGVTYDALGQWPLAARHFRRALELAPASDEAHFYYGRWLYENGQLIQAIAQLQAALRLNPSRPGTRDLLLTAYAQNGDLGSAVRLAQETVAIIPGDRDAAIYLRNPKPPGPDYWIDVSLRQYQGKNYAACLAAARRAIAIQPNSGLAWNNVAAGYAGLGQWDLAVQSERQALRVQPGFALAKNNLASYLQQISTAPPSAAEAKTPEEFLNASLRLNQAHKYRESIAAARAALHLKPDFAEAWNNMAAGYASLQEWDEAVHAAKEAIRLKPDFQLARNNLAWALSEKRNARRK